MSCRLIHCPQTTSIRRSVTQFFSMNWLKTNKLTLFTKSITVVFTFSLSTNFSKSALKNRYKMKNINDFYYKFTRILWYFAVCCANNKMMRLFFTNNAVHLIIHSGISFFQRLCNSRSWLTIDKTQATFMFNSVTILSFFVFQTVWTCLIRSSHAVSVDLFGLAPICEAESQLWCFVK